MFTPVAVITTLVSCLGFWKLNESLNSKDLIIPVPEKYAGLTRYKWRNVVGSVYVLLLFLSLEQFVPEKYAGLTRYKWRNVVGSVLHATVVSIVGAVCMYTTPGYYQDRVETHTNLGEFNIAITVGYLLYDVKDLIQYQGAFSTWPILLHHLTLIVIGLHTFLYHQYLLGYGIICALIEFNSIFLHGRQLLLMYGFSKSSAAYKLNNFFNLFTYLAFRLAIFTALFPFIFEDCDRLTPMLCNGFLLGATILLVINVILFYRLVKSDFFSNSRGKGDAGDILTNNDENVNVNGKAD